MNTIENNKLIAEFMGYEWDNENEVLTQNKFAIQNSIPHFHSDWNWLMEVVEKIYRMEVYYVYVKETSGQFDNKIELTTNISQVYNACVGFIKWYKLNN